MSGVASRFRRLPTASLVALMIAGSAQSPAHAATVVSADNFEGIDAFAWETVSGSSLRQYTDAEGGKLLLLSGSPYLPAVSKTTAVDGDQSMCVSVGVAGEHDTHSDRGEVEIGTKNGGYDIRAGKEYWYSFTVRPDPALKPNPVDPSRGTRVTDVVFQIHNTTDPALSGPPMTLSSDGVSWSFQVRGSRDAAAGYNADSQSFPLGAVHLGQWTNFVLDVKFSTDGSGWLRVWENGTLMFNKQVSNTYPDADSTSGGAFVKFGAYAWWLQSQYASFQQAALASGNTSRTYCHDRIRVADAGSTCPQLVPSTVHCDAVPPSFGYQWNGSKPVNPGPPDTHA